MNYLVSVVCFLLYSVSMYIPICVHVYVCMYIYVHLYGFPKWFSGKESACQCRRHGFDPYVGRSHGVGSGNPLQYSYWNNPTDRGAWQAIVHGVAKSQTTE